MARSTRFRRRLLDLYKRRTSWLRTILDRPKPGPPQRLVRRHVDEAISELQQLASDALAKSYARRKFERSVRGKKSWHVKRGKGRGVRQKRSAFAQWYDAHFKRAECVYVFWSNSMCEYVGKSTRGGARPITHFEKFWFGRVTRVDIYMTTVRTLPVIECLAIHRFQPRRNRSRAATRKWTRKCPLCRLHEDIETELRSMFRFR